MERLFTPEEREKLKAAHEKIEGDKEVEAAKEKAKQANQEMADLIRKKLIAADPSVEPLLDKLKDAREKMVDRVKDRQENRGPGKSAGPGAGDGADARRHGDGPKANLTEDERKTLNAAREKARTDPAVEAAKAKVDSSESPAEKQAAREALHSALQDAMAKANPETAAILEKIKAEHGGKPALN